jgi:hypothetical protein
VSLALIVILAASLTFNEKSIICFFRDEHDCAFGNVLRKGEQRLSQSAVLDLDRWSHAGPIIRSREMQQMFLEVERCNKCFWSREMQQMFLE